jgi:hypothetical protein
MNAKHQQVIKAQGIKRFRIEDNTEKVVRANFTPFRRALSQPRLRKPNHPELSLSKKSAVASVIKIDKYMYFI